MRNITIRLRIILLILLSAAFIAVVGSYFYKEFFGVKELAVSQTQQTALSGQREKLKVAVDSMAVSLGALIQRAQGPEDTVAMIREAVDTIRFEEDKSGYYFVYEGTTNVALPTNKKLHGKDLADLADKNGVKLVQELRDQAGKGGGFVEYIWPKPGAGDQPKLSYATMIPGTQMWIGTGVYIDNVDAMMRDIDGAITQMVNSALQEILVIVAVLFLVVVLPISVWIFLSITKPLAAATGAADRIASGDLDVVIQPVGRDEVTHLETALSSMVDTLRRNVTEIETSRAEAMEKASAAEDAAQRAEKALAEAQRARCQGLLDAAGRLESVVLGVSGASDEIASQANHINEGIEHQRERISSAATAVEQMNATVLDVAQNASSTAERAGVSKDKAMEGRQVVEMAVSAMERLSEIAKGMQENLTVLGQRADDVGQVMNVITDIADQTNLLALNAAIEAARAGEAGRGFAVVADEVRKLAEKTMGATKEVGEVISGIQSVSHTSIKTMDQAFEAVEQSLELSRDSDRALEEIVQLSEEAASQIATIATAAEEQSAASEEINETISEVSRIAEESAQSMSATAGAIHDMTGQTATLYELVEELKREGGEDTACTTDEA